MLAPGGCRPAQDSHWGHPPPTRSDLTLPWSGRQRAALLRSGCRSPREPGSTLGIAGAGPARSPPRGAGRTRSTNSAASGAGLRWGRGVGAESHLCGLLCWGPPGPGCELLRRRRRRCCPGDRGPRGGPRGRSSGSRRRPRPAPRPPPRAPPLPSSLPLGSGLRGSALLARYFPGCRGKSCGSTEPRPAPPRRVLAPAPVSPRKGQGPGAAAAVDQLRTRDGGAAVANVAK